MTNYSDPFLESLSTCSKCGEFEDPYAGCDCNERKSDSKSVNTSYDK